MTEPRPESAPTPLVPGDRLYAKRLSRTYLFRLIPWLVAVYVLLMALILGAQLGKMRDELVHRGERITAMYALNIAPPLATGQMDSVRHILGTTGTEREIAAAEVLAGDFHYVWNQEAIRPEHFLVRADIHLPDGGESLGEFRLYLTDDTMMRHFWINVVQALAVMALLLLTVAVITLRTQRRTILDPLNRLLDGIMASSRDRGHQDIPVARDDEIGALTRSYNTLMRELVDLLHNLEGKVAEQTEALREANARLERLAVTDGLTGLPNRRRFDEILDREWKRLARTGQPLSLILCDIDHFKKYNDHYGHQEGDHCLQAVAQTMADKVKRPSDLAARYGGEEFAIILPETGREGAMALAEEIREALKARRLDHAATERGQVTLSLGCATLTPKWEGFPSLLIQMADKALYASKEQGRDRTTCAGPEPEPESDAETAG